MTNDGSGEHNVTSATGVISANTWYYAAVVYDNAANQITFYLEDATSMPITVGSPVGTATPGWGTFTMPWLCLAAWPNPAGSCRDISGYIDAFAFSYEALATTNFRLLNLPTPPAGVRDWPLYN